MPDSHNDSAVFGNARGHALCLSERLIRTMANARDRRRQQEPERTAEALFLGIIA